MKMKISAFFGIILILSACGPNPKNFESMKEPKIIHKEKQKMLVMETTGNHDAMGKTVGKLYGAYYKLKFKGKKMAAPRARWPKPFNTPVNEWTAVWALPVAGNVTALPKGIDPSIKLDYWYDSDVAEIVHFGSYESETPTIEKLHKFISDSGYSITGAHEEEYIRGPGFFGKGNPAKYITIIRYEVEKKKD